MADLYQLAKDSLEAAEKAVKRGEEMLSDELRNVPTLITSPAWAFWTEKQQLQTLIEQIDRVNQAKTNLQQAKTVQKRFKKRARELGL